MSGPPPRPGPKAGDFLYEMTPYLVHIMFVPQVCIICLTLLDRHRDDIKWFLLNTAVINIATGVSMEIKRFPGSFLNIVNIIGMDLSRYSIFFSALTRILILHWPNSYKKATNGKRLFVWIIGCDAVLICLSYFTNPTIFATNSNIITVSDDVITFMAKFSAIVLLLVLLGTFSCSLLVLIEIRKMQKMGAQGGRSETLQDLKRAAFICLFQSITYIIYTFFPIYIGFFPAIVGPRGSPITPDQAIWRTLFSVANSTFTQRFREDVVHVETS
ncbi:hypothetical protein Ddc_14375 [Ditylenchus destructor]|nr:hypothetical protein Ddc_14375 [Ditylenchus destructor]